MSTDPVYLGHLETVKAKRSAAHQKIFLVIDDQFAPWFGPDLGWTPDTIQYVVQHYYELAISDTNIVGLAGFTWPGIAPGWLGCRSLPEAVIRKNIEIGQKIKANHSPCNWLNIQVDLKVFAEGPFQEAIMTTTLSETGVLPLSQPYNAAPWNYEGTEMVMNTTGVVDWVLVELRDAANANTATSSTLLTRSAVLLMEDGTVRTATDQSVLKFHNIVFLQNPFVVIRHRNHLPVLSQFPMAYSNGVYAYDFTTSAGQAFGSTQAELPCGVYGMIAGDLNADGTIDLEDVIIDWKNHAGSSGYRQTDGNLDGQADNKDKDDFWYWNQEKSEILPE